MTVRYSTTAFLPFHDLNRYYQGSWQQFILHFPSVEKYREVYAKREELETEAFDTGRWGKLRKFDRSIVSRYRV